MLRAGKFLRLLSPQAADPESASMACFECPSMPVDNSLPVFAPLVTVTSVVIEREPGCVEDSYFR